jgi:hypothetical protein
MRLVIDVLAVIGAITVAGFVGVLIQRFTTGD